MQPEPYTTDKIITAKTARSSSLKTRKKNYQKIEKSKQKKKKILLMIIEKEKTKSFLVLKTKIMIL